MAALEPDVEFFGIRIPPNATVSFGDKDKRDDSSSSGDDDDDDSVLDDGVDGVALFHATQVALGPNPAPGRHTVMAVKSRSLGGSGKGRAFPIGTLEVGKTEQFSIDLMWSAVGMMEGEGFDGGDVSFMHTGKSDVYITGYKTVTSMLDDERGYSGGEESDEESDDLSSDMESSEDDQEAPPGVPLRAGAKGGGGGELSSSDDDDDDDDDDDEEESDDEDSESDGDGVRAFLAPPRTPAGAKRPLGAEGEVSEDDESDDDESEDDESDDEDQPAAPPASKKAKQQAAAGGEAAAAYAGALAAFLREHGPTKLGALGAAVRRPPSLPKLTTFLTGRADFRVDGEQKVSLVLP